MATSDPEVPFGDSLLRCLLPKYSRRSPAGLAGEWSGRP